LVSLKEWTWPKILGGAVVVYVLLTTVSVLADGPPEEHLAAHGGVEEGPDPLNIEVLTDDSPEPGDIVNYTLVLSVKPDVTVSLLTIDLKGVDPLQDPPFRQEVSDTVTFRETHTHPFPVSEGASEVLVVLDGDNGDPFVGNDLDMTLRSPNGQSWESSGGGPDEQVRLRESQIQKGGYGDYEVDVMHFFGAPVISYSLTMDVLYGSTPTQIKLTNISSNQTHEFTWNFEYSFEVAETFALEIHADVEEEHDEGYSEDGESGEEAGHTSILYLADITGRVTREGGEAGFRIEAFTAGRILGILTLIMFTSAFLTGYFPPLRRRLNQYVEVESLQQIHFLLAGGTIIVGASHVTTVLATTFHDWFSIGILFGIGAALMVLVQATTGFFRLKLKKYLGERKWKWLHLFLGISVVILIILHLWLNGPHFAFLRG